MVNSTQITVPYFFFLLLLLVVCVDFGCRAQQKYVNISSSSEFQTADRDLVLICNPGSFNPAKAELVFNFNSTIVYNSTSNLANGVQAVASNPITSVRVLNRKSYLRNVVCAYNGSYSPNSLNIPYINIDQYRHSRKFELGKTVTISCQLAMNPLPQLYYVSFLFNGTTYIRYVGTDKNTQPTYNKLDIPDVEITPVLKSRYPDYSVEIKPLKNIKNFQYGKMGCQLEYLKSLNNNLKVQYELDLSKNFSASLTPAISALTLVCFGVVSYLLNSMVL